MTSQPETTDAEDRALLQREKQNILRAAKAASARYQAMRLQTAGKNSRPSKQ